MVKNNLRARAYIDHANSEIPGEFVIDKPLPRVYDGRYETTGTSIVRLSSTPATESSNGFVIESPLYQDYIFGPCKQDPPLETIAADTRLVLLNNHRTQNQGYSDRNRTSLVLAFLAQGKYVKGYSVERLYWFETIITNDDDWEEEGVNSNVVDLHSLKDFRAAAKLFFSGKGLWEAEDYLKPGSLVQAMDRWRLRRSIQRLEIPPERVQSIQDLVA